MDLYEKNGNAIYILNVLKKYSDEEHMLSAVEIQQKIIQDYDVEIDTRTIRRNINLLKYKLDYDISTREDNGKGYYINRDPETDFEPGEVRAIIDTFSYSNYVVPNIAKDIVRKCKNMQTVYENDKLKDYKIYSPKGKTTNQEVIKNIEDIADAIYQKKKIKFEYWKYDIEGIDIVKTITSTPLFSPYAIIYDKQQFYLVGIKEGFKELSTYRLDRIKRLRITDFNIEIKVTDKELQQFTDSQVEVFGGDEKEIVAVCDKILISDVYERFGKNAQIKILDKNTFQIKIKCNPLGFKMFALRNLDLCTVTKPKSLVDEIKVVIKDAQKRYK